MTLAHRQDFGFGNPNAAGAFFAVLVLAVFLIPAKWRGAGASKPGMAVAEQGPCFVKTVFGFQLLFSGIFFGCLLLTASRGALAGLGLGSVAAWAASGFPLPKSWWLVPACAALAILTALLGARAIHRVSSLSANEGSTASRIAIYSRVPAMVAAAPGGWGHGRAASAYENWFQDPGDPATFKNLLSTHATWVAERGILFFACYAAVWVLALCLCSPAALGVLVAWGTCCAFSYVGGAWWMWLVPALALGVSLHERWKRKIWPARTAWISAAVILATTCVAFFGAAALSKNTVHYDGRVVRVGSRLPALWFLIPDLSVMGKAPGKSLRALGNVAVAQGWEDVPSSSVVFLSGNAPDPAVPFVCGSITWLNPPAKISPRLQRIVEEAERKTIVWGALRTDASPAGLRAWFETLPNARWVVFPGRGRYFGDVLGNVTKL